MKKFLAILFALVFVFSLAACKSVSVVDVPAEAEELRVVADNPDTNATVVSYDGVHYFYQQYQNLLNKYGEAKFADGKLKGVAVVRFADFVGSGTQQMYVAYADGTKDYVNKQAIYLFDNGPGELLSKKGTSITADITSKDDGTPAIWLFKTDSKAYMVTGDDMSDSVVFHEYVKSSAGKDIYAFQKTTEKTEGSYVKINLTDLSEGEATEIIDVTKANVATMKDLSAKESYTIPK